MDFKEIIAAIKDYEIPAEGLGVFVEYGEVITTTKEQIENYGDIYAPYSYLFYSFDVEEGDGVDCGKYTQYGEPQSENKEIKFPFLKIDWEYSHHTSCEWEMYGDCGVNVTYHYNVVVNDCYETVFQSSNKWSDDIDLTDRVVSSVAREICSDKGSLIRAFEIMDFCEEECFMPLCEDHQLMGEEYDIRILINEEDTYVECSDFNFCVRLFIEKHFCEGLVEILAPQTYVSNAFSLQMVADDCDVKIRHISQGEFDDDKSDAVSYVGHRDTADVLNVAFHRGFLSLKEGDTLYVAQLTNGRLPDGTTNLPENFVFKYVKISVKGVSDV